MFLTAVIFIIILGLLIFVHELGHFLVAKKSGVKVEEFAFGFPPRIFSFKKGGTNYSINLIPLGGYVKMLGEEEDIDKPGSFHAKSPWVRSGIVVAGVIMNFLLAIILMTIGFTVGMTPLVSDPATMGGVKESRVMVTYVQPDSAAAKAKIENGTILNGFSSPSELQTFTRANLGKEVDISTTYNSQTKLIKVKLSENKDAPFGVGIVSITKVKQPIHQAFVTSIVETGRSISTLFSFLGTIIKNLFTTGHPGEEAAGVVGPVGLFNFTGAAIKLGWIYVLQLVIILSINLGIVNILPYPALDGGKLLFLVLEGIFKRKVIRMEIENAIHMVGFALLIILFLLITLRDLNIF